MIAETYGKTQRNVWGESFFQKLKIQKDMYTGEFRQLQKSPGQDAF